MQGIDGRWHGEGPLVVPAPPLPPAPPPEFTAADSEELRFSLKELFLATTIAAVMLALFRSIDIFGALLSFLAAAGTTLFVVPRIFPSNLARQRILFDFVWGMVMPVVCLVFDPFVFKNGEFADEYGWLGSQGQVQIYDAAYLAWPFLAGQIATPGFVLFGGKSLRPIASLLAGVLGAGFALAVILAVLMALPATGGAMYFGIGLLGFTPIFTCITYHRRMRLMWHLAREKEPELRRMALAVLGIVLCLALPLIIGSLALAYAPPQNGEALPWFIDK